MSKFGFMVLRKKSQSCNENFENDLTARLDYVKDETMDEDGDWATGFIRADSIPNLADTSLSQVEPIGSESGVGSCDLYIDTKGPITSHSTCSFCKKEVPIKDIFLESKCGCCVCKSCIVRYVEMSLYNDNQDMKSIKSKDMKIGLSCSLCFCEDCVSLSQAQVLAPEAFKKWQQDKDRLLFKTSGFLSCPSCATKIEKWPTNAPPSLILVEDSNDMVSCANYTHCPNCQIGFCRACMTAPYHQGKCCSELEEEKHDDKCRYCESPISSTNLVVKSEDPSKSIRDLRHESNNLGLDSSWCIMKKEFAGILQSHSSVCKAEECRKRMLQNCTRILECGHRCGGISGEQICPPCLEEKCQDRAMLQMKRRPLPSGDDICPICSTLSLRKAPSIHLRCGHIVHFNCAKNKFTEGSSGLAITLDSLCCPQCSTIMQHYSLASVLQRHLELLDLASEKAVERLRIDRPGNPQYLEDDALNYYRYYLCQVCGIPYCGGTRDPRNNERNMDPHEPICGGCIAARSQGKACHRGHGKRFIQYKCRHCCSVADNHCKLSGVSMCKACYLYGQEHHYVPSIECKGPKWCPLGMVHAPHKRECCLGCSECRKLGQ